MNATAYRYTFILLNIFLWFNLPSQNQLSECFPGSFKVIEVKVEKRLFKSNSKPTDTLFFTDYKNFRRSKTYKDVPVSLPIKHDSAYVADENSFLKTFQYQVTSVTDATTNKVLPGYKSYAFLYNHNDLATYMRYYFLYNHLNQLIEYRLDGYQDKIDIRYAYNKKGQLVSINGNVKMRLKYDEKGRVIKVTLLSDSDASLKKGDYLEITYQ